MEQKFPKLIYIMGTGRSATTILEILISNNPGICGVGEITHIFRDGLCRNVSCSCGEKAHHCVLWGNVFKNNHLSKSLPLYYKKLFHRVDWHSGFIKHVMGFFSNNQKKDYQRINYFLFKRISDINDCQVIVDSSKYAGRAIALSRAFPGKVKVICLTRSPVGLINAFTRIETGEQKPKMIHAIITYYLFVMLCCRIAINIIGNHNCTVITFEQLMKEPEKVLTKIERLIDIRLDKTRQKILEDDFFKIDHIVTGNRLKKKEPSNSNQIS
jgi:hypothetical protein